MCIEGTGRALREEMGRRRFLGVAATGAATALGCAAVSKDRGSRGPSSIAASRVVDLTHPLGPDFPTYSGQPQLEIEEVVRLERDGYNGNQWNLFEHTGTHIDAPFHFSDGWRCDEIPISHLVAPLAVIDLRERARRDSDTRLTADDLLGWEQRNGRLPENGCVALLSGWTERVGRAGFRNADDAGVLHFPGFHPEAASFLLEERTIVGVAVDTLSLDHGPSPDFAFHRKWLPENRWGLECVAHLDRLPQKGATIVVGAPKIRGASGGPSRVLALV